jgi:hypothetical protein
MATEKQLAANRANAAKSTGPRSAAGKKRAAQNSFQHGLSVRLSDLEFSRQREKLAHQIAGDTNSELELDVARAAAEGDLDLARVRALKAGLIDRVNVTGSLVPPEPFQTKKERTKHFNAKLRALKKFDEPPPDPIPINPADSLPISQAERAAEATRRVLPQLIKLTRYENGAASRRDRNIKRLIRLQSRD